MATILFATSLHKNIHGRTTSLLRKYHVTGIALYTAGATGTREVYSLIIPKQGHPVFSKDKYRML